MIAGTEKSIENYQWAHAPPTREDVSAAWMIIAHLKVKTDVTPEPALREFMAMQYTAFFDKANGPTKGIVSGSICLLILFAKLKLASFDEVRISKR